MPGSGRVGSGIFNSDTLGFFDFDLFDLPSHLPIDSISHYEDHAHDLQD